MGKNNKILIVEDDEMVRKIMQEVLQNDFDLSIAAEGSKALEMADQETPDLVLLDVMMPGKNGFEVCEELRAKKALDKTIIIMVTALSDKDSEKKGLNAGADDFLTKPFNPIELRTKIRMMFRLRDRLIRS